MKSTGAEEANVSSHVFTLPVCPLTAIGSTVRRICFCTLGNFRMDLAIHDHSCQVPDHSYTMTHSGINTTVAGCPSSGQRTTERGKTRTRKMQQRLRPRNSGALVLRFQHDPVATQRKSSHQTVSATTRRKDIIKGIRGEGKMLEYS